jgi:glutamyl/glutaminyl-tRNA synthetase
LGIKGKDLFFPIRLAIYGKSKGPEIPKIMKALGRDETESRIARVLVDV